MFKTATTDDILELLKEVKNQKWSVVNDGEIRNQDGACPICALARSRKVSCTRLQAFSSAKSLGYDIDDPATLNSVKGIIQAADGISGHIRKQLIEILNVTY